MGKLFVFHRERLKTSMVTRRFDLESIAFPSTSCANNALNSMQHGLKISQQAVPEVNRPFTLGCSSTSCQQLRKNFLNGMVLFNPSQSKSQSLVLKSESRVIDSEQVKNRCLNIADIYLALDGMKSEFVGSSILMSLLDSATAHPHREGLRMVVATK